MKYLVIFYEEYVGHHFDEYSKLFSDKAKAHIYCDKLNVEFAKANMCEVADLGDYYVIETLEVE